MRMMNLLLAVGLCAVLSAGCSKKPANQKTETDGQKANAPARAEGTAKIGDPAGSLEGLEFVKGGPVTIEKGKIYVVEFWATWCPPCLRSIPHLTEVAAKVKDKGVQIVGISNEKPEVVKPFVEKQGDNMNYVVAIDADSKVGTAYMNAYGQGGIPTAFIVDKAGKVVWFGHPMADMEEVLEQVIAGTFDAQAYAKKKAEEQAAYEANVKAFRDYFAAVEAGTADAAKTAADLLVEKAPAGMLNEMAWNILTRVAEDKRDKAVALRAAEKAHALTEGKDPAILDTYALALFVNGKTAEAIAAEEKAIGLVKDNAEYVAEFTKRLEEFKAAGRI